MSDGGSVRLATVSMDGAEPVLFKESALPAMGDLAWAPGSRIHYQVAGNRSFMVLDPDAGSVRPLVAEPDSGGLFAAVPSPKGDRVAVYWNRRPQGGVWLLSTRDTARALLREGRADPIG